MSTVQEEYWPCPLTDSFKTASAGTCTREGRAGFLTLVAINFPAQVGELNIYCDTGDRGEGRRAAQPSMQSGVPHPASVALSYADLRRQRSGPACPLHPSAPPLLRHPGHVSDPAPPPPIPPDSAVLALTGDPGAAARLPGPNPAPPPGAGGQRLARGYGEIGTSVLN